MKRDAFGPHARRAAEGPGGPVEVVPLYIGPRNAEQAVGHPWRWCLTFARRAGVPVLQASATGGQARSLLIPAAALAEALQREAATGDPAPEQPAELDEDEELDAVLAEMGKRRRAS